MITNKMKNPPFTVASLFAGIGGFCFAFKNAGFRVAWANENDVFAASSYQENHQGTKLFTKSIVDLSVNGDDLEPVDVLTAGFPCQPFSVAGQKAGFGDPRGKLFFEITRLLKEFGDKRPKIVVMENVKNLLHHDGGKTFNKMIEELKFAGYWCSIDNAAILNTETHTDIPQNRERLFIVALSWDFFDINDFEFPSPVGEKRKVQSFLDMDEPAPAEYYFDPKSKYGKLFVEKMSEGSPDSVYLLRRYYVRENRNNSVFTLTANMGEGGHNVPVIKDSWGIRKMTPIECLRLQGFSDSFVFPPDVSRSQQYKQVGNAVTVGLVEKIAWRCLEKLKSIAQEESTR